MSKPSGVQTLTGFFEGTVLAAGFFEDRFGNIRRRFCVTMQGQEEDGMFLLREDFVYDDGEQQERIWRIRAGTNGAFEATAADVIGHVEGTTTADAVVMRYRMRTPIEGRSIVLSFKDRLYWMDDTMALSRAIVTKWGIKIGEVSITYRKVQTASTAIDPIRTAA